MKYVRFAKIASLCALVFGLTILARHSTHHFTLDRIDSPLPAHPEWEFWNPPIVEEILSQPFHFYDSGGQCWVFLSDDGRWILKFFDFRLTWYDLTKNLPLPEAIRPKLTLRQLHRREAAPSAYAIALARFKEECGLIGAFLNGKKSGVTHLTIYDPIRCEHTIDLGNKAFVLQKRGEPLEHKIAALLKAGKTSEASSALSQALNLVSARCSAGIADDDDLHIHRNLGFIGDEAIYLDAGKFRDAPNFLLSQNAEREIVRTADLLISKIAQEKP